MSVSDWPVTLETAPLLYSLDSCSKKSDKETVERRTETQTEKKVRTRSEKDYSRFFKKKSFDFFAQQVFEVLFSFFRRDLFLSFLDFNLVDLR
jgi:hypothetical protein